MPKQSQDNGYAGQFHDVTIADGSVNTLAFGDGAQLPSVLVGGEKLVFNSYADSPNMLRRDLAHPELPPVDIVPSSRGQYDAQYSPDGKRTAFASQRSGMQGVWVSDEDGGDLVQISDPAQSSGSPQWSPDGNKIAFDSLSRGHWKSMWPTCWDASLES